MDENLNIHVFMDDCAIIVHSREELVFLLDLVIFLLEVDDEFLLQEV